jgi:sigma-B regulation protein RsbU (phosphoserine phosphatase)
MNSIAGTLRALQRPLNVLVVDDDVLLREFLALQIGAHGCEVSLVGDGEQALEELAARSYDVVITDWQMPRVDGIELVERLRAQPSGDRYLYIIMMTTKAAERTIRTGLQAGVDDFLYKPVDALQLELGLATARRIVDLQSRLSRRNRHLVSAHNRTREAYRRIKSDLEVAAATQRQLLPQPNLGDGPFRYASLFMPSMDIGGDTLSVTPLDDQRLLFFHVDVSGHGVPAALGSVSAHHQLAMMRPDRAALPQCVAELNETICERRGDMYFTMVCGVADGSTGKLSFVRAGHPMPLLLRKGEPPRFLEEGGTPVGLIPNMEFPLSEVQLASGERLLLYSDGVTDAENAAGEPFGEARFASAAERAKETGIEDFLSAMRDTLLSHCGSRHLEDDVSVLVIERV